MVLKVSHAVFFAVLITTLSATGSASATYQKGSITPSSSTAQKSYDLKNGDRGYQISNCGDFQTGQTVEYRVKDTTVYIRREDGKEYKCAIKAELINDPTAGAHTVVWQSGTILGYESLYRTSRGSSGSVRRANVYELRGPDLIYLVDFCGSFQAGQFTTGQVVEFRVDAERLYIRHDNNKEYNCQIEGRQKLEDPQPDKGAQAAAVPAPAPVTTTAKLSITSVPDGADIELDGKFAGNTPSDLAVPDGEHAITITKSGYKAWERKMNVVGGSSVRLNAELEKATTPQ